MNPARILLADDHRILAEGLRGLLEPEFRVVATVGDGRQMIEAALRERPDVVIADISMPVLNGIDAAIRMRDSGVTARVIFLTMHHDVAYARRALDAGAAGYLLKHSAATELVTAVREVLAGHTYVAPAIAADLLESYRRTDPSGTHDLHHLTVRQREVLQLFAEGRSAKEVAAVLKISTRTAEFHRAQLLRLLGLRSIADLVQFSIRNGLISV
jgi:DNA-binding NarL/FixJ family response regulator